MKKTIPTLMICMILAVSPVLVPTLAKKEDKGKSNTVNVYLYEKDPDDWSIVKDGAWGKLTYHRSGRRFKFVFNGEGLEVGSDYSLIYYPDPWPGTGLIVLAMGTAVIDPDDPSRLGVIHLKGNDDSVPSLPIEEDDNYETGAKIWLVLSSDVGAGKMIGWNPTEYLFENNLINYEKTGD